MTENQGKDRIIDKTQKKEPVADRKPSSTEARYPPQVCEVCNTVMYGLHCKIVCPNCGYRRDCSDP